MLGGALSTNDSVFGPDYEWDSAKLRQKKNDSSTNSHSVLAQEEHLTDIIATHTSKLKQRTVAILLVDIKSTDNQ